MAYGGGAGNRYFWRSAWATLGGWVEMIHTGNIGSQSVNYATSAGTASSANSVAWGNVSSKPSNIMYYQSFTLDANTMDSNATGFTYSVNAPYTGPIVRFSTGGSYDLWLNAPYGGNGYGLAFRTRNGDAGTLNSWQYPAVYGVNANGGGDLYANVYYDSQNTGYYLDPNGRTNLSTLTVNGGTNYFYGITYFETNNGGYCGSTDSAKLQAYSSSNNSAFLSFHKGGHYATNMGLDADNVIRIGGWSMSANRFQMDASGNLTMAGDVTAYSDARVKTNIQTIENALEKTLALRGVTYNRTDSEDVRTKVGVIAQEIIEVLPEVVNQDNDGMYNVSYGNITALLIEAIKEQQLQIEELKSKLDGLTK
jgi:hypothetical protein